MRVDLRHGASAPDRRQGPVVASTMVVERGEGRGSVGLGGRQLGIRGWIGQVLIVDDGGGVERFVWLPADDSATEAKAAHALALLDSSSSTTARTVVVTAGTEPVRLLFNLPKCHDPEQLLETTGASMSAVRSVMDTLQLEHNLPARAVPSADDRKRCSAPVLLSLHGTQLCVASAASPLASSSRPQSQHPLVHRAAILHRVSVPAMASRWPRRPRSHTFIVPESFCNCCRIECRLGALCQSCGSRSRFACRLPRKFEARPIFRRYKQAAVDPAARVATTCQPGALDAVLSCGGPRGKTAYAPSYSTSFNPAYRRTSQGPAPSAGESG
jgi:hypothetical protein